MSKTTDIETTPLDPEAQKVIDWRVTWLRHSGYSKRNSRLIAETKIGLWFACDALKHAKQHGYDEDYVIKLLL